MILTIWLSTHFAENITRTCGDDPESRNDTDLSYPYYPHMRGWSLFLLVGYPWYLILPAHAGMILPLKTWRSKLLNITRTCGDDPQDKSHSRLNCSYYPHMRGWSFLISNKQNSSYILPAHAGMILRHCLYRRTLYDITRTCGDDPASPRNAKQIVWYYPHMRGWSYDVIHSTSGKSILPAHAGMIPVKTFKIKVYRYITRTCGDDPKSQFEQEPYR